MVKRARARGLFNTDDKQSEALQDQLNAVFTLYEVDAYYGASWSCVKVPVKKGKSSPRVDEQVRQLHVVVCAFLQAIMTSILKRLPFYDDRNPFGFNNAIMLAVARASFLGVPLKEQPPIVDIFVSKITMLFESISPRRSSALPHHVVRVPVKPDLDELRQLR